MTAFTWTSLALVVLGGAIGAVARWGFVELSKVLLGRGNVMVSASIGIAVANVLASFVLGVVVAGMNGDWALFLAVGVTGSLSTYSSFALDTIDLARAGRSWTALFTVVVSLTAGLLALALGQALGAGIAGG